MKDKVCLITFSHVANTQTNLAFFLVTETAYIHQETLGIWTKKRFSTASLPVLRVQHHSHFGESVHVPP